jgi:hypothetical protein
VTAAAAAPTTAAAKSDLIRDGCRPRARSATAGTAALTAAEVAIATLALLRPRALDGTFELRLGHARAAFDLEALGLVVELFLRPLWALPAARRA